MRKLISALLIGLTICSSTKAVFASSVPSNVELIGEADGIIFFEKGEPFLFGPDMLPGSTVNRTLLINNKYTSSYELFMRAERVSPQEEYDLFDKLMLTIYHDDVIIYQGPAHGADELGSNISLGTFKPGDISTLYAEVELVGPEIGNEYKNKSAQVDWIFTAVRGETDKPDPTPTPDTGDNNMMIYIILGVSSIILLALNNTRKNKSLK